MARTSKSQIDIEASGLIAVSQPETVEFPAEITTDLQAIYSRLVATNPSQHLFSAASEPMMIQLCRHIATSNKLARLQHRANDPQLIIALAKEQRAESASIASLSTKLKLSPSAISQHRGDLIHKPTTKKKPWEWTGEGYEA